MTDNGLNETWTDFENRRKSPVQCLVSIEIGNCTHTELSVGIQIATPIGRSFSKHFPIEKTGRIRTMRWWGGRGYLEEHGLSLKILRIILYSQAKNAALFTEMARIFLPGPRDNKTECKSVNPVKTQ